MKGFVEIKRCIYSSQRFSVESYSPWKDYLDQYGGSVVPEVSLRSIPRFALFHSFRNAFHTHPHLRGRSCFAHCYTREQ